MHLNSSTAYGMAGGALASALLDTLVEKGLLTNTDVLAILTRAQEQLSDFHTSDGEAGARILGELYDEHRKSGL